MHYEVTDDHVEPESKCDDDSTDNNSEPHLIDFSLLDTLLPDIELEGGLERVALLAQCLNIVPKPIVDGL